MLERYGILILQVIRYPFESLRSKTVGVSNLHTVVDDENINKWINK